MEATGPIIPSKAIPVGIKRRNGAHRAASFGSWKKFYTTSDRPK